MPLPANSLEQVLQFEYNLETGFVAYFQADGLNNVTRSRGLTEFEAPQINLWYQNGVPIEQWQRPMMAGIPGAYLPWGAYTGTLTTECATDRFDDPNGTKHTTLIAQLRKAMMIFRLVTRWKQYQEIMIPFDIREGGTVDSIFDQEKGLDISVITWNIRANINPAAWPSNLEL